MPGAGRSAPLVVPAGASGEGSGSHHAPMVGHFTFVLWTGLVAIGLTGMLVAPRAVFSTQASPRPVQAELLAVELTPGPVPISQPDSPLPPAELPPSPSPVLKPQLTAMKPVAAADAIVAFAPPVEGPVQIVSTAEAAFSRVPEADQPAGVSAPVQSMVFGQGEGRQEAPEYPRQARRERQEGAVGVKFSVGQNGRVLEAALSSPSPWPLLNEAALKVIRDRWRFRAGDLRVFEVFIRFEMKR